MEFLILLLLVTGLFVAGIFGPQIKGIVGEKTVSAILHFLDNSKYIVLNNVVLNTGGRTAQIDHIVISDFGLFIIETKNYKGWIFGSENSEYWTQVIYSRKERFYNPIRQNAGHIRAIKQCIPELNSNQFISIIVFSSKASLKINTDTIVTNTSGLLNAIKRHNHVVLTQEEKENIFQAITLLDESATYNKREHIESIQQNIFKKERSIEQGKCPHCGNELILRSGKFGRFWGCKAYPVCKFTRTM